ncbi:MAG TPA: lysylphosphatidylglycerol synthase transmembrane domain-containing protein [Hyphomicrobiaceae bacterium]|nr:lysylphosphatidylglycerol synthase transmembrane domain-containing protein [Hyphomicrobiaceae bacterium]
MRIDLPKLLAGLSVSLALIGFLLWNADLSTLSFTSIRIDLAVATVAAFLCCVGCRAASLRTLAPAIFRGSWPMWFRLAARHQFVFMLAPSGIGDVGFPFLAQHYAGLGASDAVRIIAQFRLRDVLILMLLAAIGGVSGGAEFGIVAPGILVGLVSLYFVEDVAAILFRVAALLVPSSRVAAFLHESIAGAGLSRRDRAIRVALALAIWFFAGTAMSCAFAAVGRPLSVSEVMLMLAALNLIGLLAISIGGLGIAEVGVAGVLIGFGDTAGNAAATALMARPILLISMTVACGLLDMHVSLSQVLFRNGAKH